MNKAALLAAKNAMVDVTADLMPDDDITDAMVKRVIGAYEEARQAHIENIPSEGVWAVDGDGAIVLTAGEGATPDLVAVNYGPGSDLVELSKLSLAPLTKSRAKDLNRNFFSDGWLADDDGVYRWPATAVT